MKLLIIKPDSGPLQGRYVVVMENGDVVDWFHRFEEAEAFIHQTEEAEQPYENEQTN